MAEMLTLVFPSLSPSAILHRQVAEVEACVCISGHVRLCMCPFGVSL